MSFYLAGWLAFSLIKIVSLSLHFLGRTPYGLPVVQDPVRFLPNAIVFEAGLLLAGAVLIALAERVTRPLRVPPVAWRLLLVLLGCAWILFGQFDQEVVRWLGNHVTLSYLRTYAGAQDPQLLARLFGADLGYFFASLFLGVIAPAASAFWLWRRRRSPAPGLPTLSIAALIAAVFVAFPFWWNFSEKRWRRIRPAGVEIVGDWLREVRGLDRPHRADRALSDLASFMERGRLADSIVAVKPYPLWHEGTGLHSPEAFADLPLEERPNIVLVMFETLRGWRSGLADDPAMAYPHPPLAAFLKKEAAYFPWAHSHGFPSVEGCASIHLGLWSHYSNVIISDYIHIRTRSLPEILRSAGYRAEMVFGYDPSFGNFTPWMHRWYDRLEYNPENNVDGPLLKRVAELTDTLSDKKPWMVTLWTTVTHPPFDVPAAEGVVPAADVDDRYDQSLAYAGREMLAFFETLKKRPDWKRTVVVMVGDHSTPTSWQIRHADRVGDLSPGHTWTSMAFFGGWPGLKARGASGLRRTTASQADIGPTVLGLLNLRAPNHFMGRDLFADGADDSERGFLTARFDAAALVDGENRLSFRMDGNDEAAYYRVSKASSASYGLLDASVSPQAPPAALYPGDAVERYRDVLRQYGALLEADSLVPPGAIPVPKALPPVR